MAIPASTRTVGSVTDGDLRTEVIRTAFESQLSRALKLVPACNRQFEEQMRNANSVRYYIDQTALGVRNANAPTSGDTAIVKWRTSSRNTQDLTARRLVWQKETTIDLDIPVRDVSELSVPLLVQGTDLLADRIAGELDDYVHDTWQGVNLTAVPQGIDRAKGTDIGNLDQSDIVGTASNYIDDTGTEQGTLKLLPLFEALKLKLKQANKAGDVARTPTDVWTVYMNPHIYLAIQRELKALSNTTGIFHTEIIEGVERKRLYGIFEIEEYNFPVTTGASTAIGGESLANGKDYYPVMFTHPRATTFGTRNGIEQETLPGTPAHDGPYYKYDRFLEYYCAVTDPRFLYKWWVREEA